MTAIPRIQIRDKRIYDALRRIAVVETLQRGTQTAIQTVAIEILIGIRPAIRIETFDKN